MIDRAGDDPPRRQRRDRHADRGVVDRQQRDGDGHLPQHLGVVAGVAQRAVVAHEHLADEEHDLGQEREREEDREHRPDLGEHVVDAR